MTTVAGAIWGYALAWGKALGKIQSQGQVLGKLEEGFVACQKRGLECTASTRVLLEGMTRRLDELQAGFASHKASVHQHHESQAIHTTDEWRKSVMDRFDRIEEAFEKKMDDQTRTLLSRIESVEKAVRNGGK